MARRVQTWEASGAVAHGVAMPALLLGDRLGTQLNEMTQDIGASLSWIQRSGGVDGLGELVGFGEQMARTNGRHRASVSPGLTVKHRVIAQSREQVIVVTAECRGRSKGNPWV